MGKSSSSKILTFIPAEGVIIPHSAKDVISALRRLGQDVAWIDLKAFTESQKELLVFIEDRIRKERPDFIFTLNTIGLTPNLFTKYKVPYVSWFTMDPRRSPLDQYASPLYYIFVCSREAVVDLKRDGFKHVFYLPLCTNPDVFKKIRLKSEDLRRYSCNVSFVGTWRLLRPKEDSLPIFEGMIKKAMDYPNTPIKGLFDRLLRWKSGTEVNFSSIEKILWIIEDEAMTRYRGDILLSLSRFGVNLYGNPEMRDLETRGIRYCGWVDNRRELPKVYNATKINIALSISSLKDALNISVFNILASSGFMITNTRSDLLRLFRKDEVVCFEDKMDLIGKVDYYLKNPKEREEIALQGQRRVLKEHTFLHRMKEVLSVMGDFIN